MANYRYIAKTFDGKEVDGVMQADSEAAVIRTLGERSLYPVDVSLQQQPQGLSGRGDRVRPREVGLLFSQMADLLHAGVPLLRTLEVLRKTTSRRGMVNVIQGLHEEVSQGQSLAQAMAEYPNAFSDLHVAMVRAGEEAGFLEDVLTNISGFIERQDELRNKVRGAMIYPMLLTGIGGTLLVLVLVLMVPNFKPFFEDMSLPLPTQLLFGISDLLVHHFTLLLALTVLAVLGLWSFLTSRQGRDLWERVKLRIPLVGRVARSVSITRFCRILGTMLRNGVPILQALEIGRNATGSMVLSNVVDDAAESVRAGEPLADPLKASEFFPPEIVEMIAVAEESNQLDSVLVEVADTVEKRTNREVDTAVRLIEPLILVLLALTIGLVAVGLLYPIFTMSEALT